MIGGTAAFQLRARRLSHRVPTIGYQLAEPDGHRMVPERLAAVGISGPGVGRLAQQGWLDVDGRRVNLPEVSEPRLGQRFAFIMDTRLCEAAFALAEGRVLARLADSALLCVRWGHTPRRVVLAAMVLLREAGVILEGAALTRVNVKAHGQSGYADAEIYQSRYSGYFGG